jgi:hypothetical protein
MPRDVSLRLRAADKSVLILFGINRRHQSPIIPIRVGPTAELFSVHRDILTKSEYFRKMINGGFLEGEEQSIDLPEEDPAIFHFVVAYLYEAKFVPIKPIASVLSKFLEQDRWLSCANSKVVQDLDKGKGKENDGASGSEEGTDSTAGLSDDRYVISCQTFGRA